MYLSYKKADFSQIRSFTLAVLLCFFFCIRAHAHTNVQIFKVEEFANFGNYQSVTVNLANNTNADGYSGFSFLIHYDTTYLSYRSAQPDSLLNACNWTTFSTTEITPGLIRISAEADLASCHLANQNGKLCLITFKVTNNTTYTFDETNVQFFWQECFDNYLKSVSEDSLFVVDTARLHPTLPPLATPNTLPSFAGIPDSCAALDYNGKPLSRSVTFISELVEMQSDFTMPKGDVNLNGIINEPADRDRFADEYFSFNIIDWGDPAMVAQTDVNGDGISMTIADLAFIQRLIIEDTVPVMLNDGDPPLVVPWVYSPDTAIVYHNIASKTVSVSYPGRIVLMGMGIPLQLSDIHFSDSVAIYRDTADHNKTSGFLFAGSVDGFNGTVFTYTGELNTAGIGGIYDFQQRLLYNRVITTGQCGDFNTTGSVTVADLVYMVGFLFNSGPQPMDIGSGDINCSGSTTIADLVRLVSYLFNSGPAPCCNN